MQYIYLHGFASSPQSYKAQYLKKCFQSKEIELEILDLNQGDFTNLTLTRQIEQTVNSFSNAQTPITLIGSSFGALTSVWVAEKHPQVERLILLAPAFNFLPYWLAKLGTEQIKQWEISGYLSVYHYGQKKLLPLSYNFLEDANSYDESSLQKSIPTLMIHGKNDEVIPVEASVKYASKHPQVELVVLDSDHSLNDKMETIWQTITIFFTT